MYSVELIHNCKWCSFVGETLYYWCRNSSSPRNRHYALIWARIRTYQFLSKLKINLKNFCKSYRAIALKTNLRLLDLCSYRLIKGTQQLEFKSWTRLFAFSIALIPLLRELDMAIRFQILKETGCISHSFNTLGKGTNPIILPLAMGK